MSLPGRGALAFFRVLPLAALLATALPGTAPAQPAPTVYFLVAGIDAKHGDSYVLPLADSLHIAQARTLVAIGPGAGVGSIAVARIAAGADGVNRNVLAPGEPLWSWHVTSFEGFADATIELCDGSPTMVEDDVAGWIANTAGVVCFWSYTVVAELGDVPALPHTWGRLKARYRGSGRAPRRAGASVPGTPRISSPS